MGRALAALIALALSAGLVPAHALAHAVLVSSRPAANSTISAGPADMDLTFDSRVDARRSRLFLKNPTGKTQILKPDGAGATSDLTAHVNLAPGRYDLDYEVLSIDGHVTRGTIPFTVIGR